MEIVSGNQAPVLERTEAAGLLREMAAVVRTIFAVDVAPLPVQEAPQEIHLTTAGAGGVPGLGGAAPAPAVVPPASATSSTTPPATPLATPPATTPASIPVPGVAILQEIAFLDD